MLVRELDDWVKDLGLLDLVGVWVAMEWDRGREFDDGHVYNWSLPKEERGHEN